MCSQNRLWSSRKTRLPPGCEDLLPRSALRPSHLYVLAALLSEHLLQLLHRIHGGPGTALQRPASPLGVGLGYSREDIHDLIGGHPDIVCHSTENIEEKHAAWGRQLGLTATQVRGMAVKHPVALGLDPEGDLTRLKIRFHSEVRRSLRVHPLICCTGQG